MENDRQDLGQLTGGFRLETVWQDLGYASRQLRRNPGFALTAILTLALGIGASTAVFSVAYGVLIDPFPYKDVHTLATPKLCSPQWSRCGSMGYSPAQFNEIVEHTDIFSGVTASTISDVLLTGEGEPQRLRGNYITPNTFDVLGVQPILGRATTEADVVNNQEEVALLSYRYWQAHYGGSRAILGRTLNFNGHPRTIIGIMPPRFLWRGGDVYLPIKMTNEPEVEGQSYFALVGRLKPGVTEAQAAAELKPIFDDFQKAAPFRFPKDLRLGILPFDEMFKSGLASTLHLLLGSAFVLLFIACVNVSSLLLARAVNREREFVIRASVGASRQRLVRHALTESLFLALASMPVALAFAYAGLRATLMVVPVETIPDEAVITMNFPVLLCSLVIALATVLVFGLAPAWHSASPRLAAALNRIRSSGGKAQRRLLSGFVVTEIALSLALLMLAGLMVRSLIAVESVPVPFPPDRTVTMRLPMAAGHYPTPESRSIFYRDLLDRVQAIPGVSTATVDAATPFMDMDGELVQIAGEPVDRRIVSLHLTSPEFLPLSGRTMLQGHFLDAREISAQSHDAVISASFARRYFAGENAVGRIFHLPEFKPDGKNKLADDAFTVVGVMSDLPYFTYFREDYPHILLPYTVAPASATTLLVSTSLPAGELINPVRRTVYSIDREQPIVDAMTLRQMLDMYGYAGPRFSLVLFGTFAAAALVLALVGVYGVLSFVTTQRTQEIGIRMALGANRADVMAMVLRQALLLALLGVAVGLPLALLAGRLAQGEVVQTSQYDPLALITAVCILPLLAVAGTYLPARRAANVNPVAALRAD
ncbi:MAG TPA: ABC transporter permease [Terracidiphilus sp.]|nr:ABC transporter permease [Terracidiphilus sp.]